MPDKKRLSDQTKSVLVRMWFAGMVCFFIAWTPIGGGQAETNAFLFQMIILLSLGLFLTNLTIVNPVIRGMFKTKLDRKAYYGQNVLIRSGKHLLHLFLMGGIVTIIWLSYVVINIVLAYMGLSSTTGRPIIMLEPITFGILYGFYYYLIESITYKYLPKGSK